MYPVYIMLLAAACITQSKTKLASGCDGTLSVPAYVIEDTPTGSCPSEARLNEAKNQLRTRISSSLSNCSNISSCSDLPPNSSNGYYWIRPTAGQPAVQAHCNFDRQCGCTDRNPGAWTRLSLLNMSNPDQQCPNTWLTQTSPTGIRSCGKASTSQDCVSTQFPTNGMTYSRVCGRITAYHDGAPDGFNTNNASIESPYLDGLSLTYGVAGSRQHVWSFIAAVGEGDYPSVWLCDCSSTASWGQTVPSYVGNNYFCDTGNHAPDWVYGTTYYDDPLWDGEGCQRGSTCCQFNNPPQFCTTLPQPTTQDLELRNCHYASGGYNTLINLVEIYVQ